MRATCATPVRGAVRFDDVTFAYATGGDVLHGLDFEIPAGETHAIVGATGAGKSTIVKLLLRLYEPTRGPDLHRRRARSTSSPIGSLRGSMGFVSQDVFLFQGTVRENLTYGRPDATDADVVWAARLAEAHDFVEALPDGYDTIVGERGQKLSGGQRQRLTIARAILRDPAILVLDEATSAVDNETEAAIQRSLAHVSADRTTIVIAHRLSTVRHAHRIHVLEAGRDHRGRHPRGARRPRRPLRRPLARPDRRSHRRRRTPSSIELGVRGRLRGAAARRRLAIRASESPQAHSSRSRRGGDGSTPGRSLGGGCSRC